MTVRTKKWILYGLAILNWLFYICETHTIEGHKMMNDNEYESYVYYHAGAIDLPTEVTYFGILPEYSRVILYMITFFAVAFFVDFRIVGQKVEDKH